jgi:hypothetical protein
MGFRLERVNEACRDGQGSLENASVVAEIRYDGHGSSSG